jgi:1,4-dihydroxy-2-naphthoyl-CoA hydrolase
VLQIKSHESIKKITMKESSPLLFDPSNTLLESLGIEFLTTEKDLLIAKMPVDHRTQQIEGILHGGASAALIETLASVGSYLNINPETQFAVGTELNVSHLSSAKEGWVTGTAKPFRVGKNVHVWNIELHSEDSKKLISVGRCSLLVKERTDS